MEILTKSAKETKAFGKKVLSDLIINGKPLILALTGDLGSGKTTFVQGLAKGLGIKRRILSPTFIIMRKYRIKLKTRTSNLKTTTKKLKHKNFYHIDLYRLEENIESEMQNLGTDDVFSESANIVVIEWAEKGRKAIPKDAVWVKFENLGGDSRKIKIID
jgi:tRNA threonylcarbamoyladenosine biosynthesis protein TsaE